MAVSRFFRHALVTSALLAGSLAASAAVVVYTFNTTQVGAFGAGPYGTVTLTENGANVDVMVALRSDLNFVNTGGPHAVFSFNAVNAVAGDVTNVLFNGSSSSLFSVTTDSVNTPFGQFELLIDCTDSNCKNGQPGNMPDPLTFTLLNSTAADFAFLSTTPGTPAYFASDVICMTGACQGSTGAIGATGGGVPSSGGTPSAGQAPEPGSSALALLGLGIMGLGFMARRKQKAGAAV